MYKALCQSLRTDLPMPAISRGITTAATKLREGEEAWSNVAKAIMTTDTYPKLVTTQCSVGGKKVTFTGIAKGSGMVIEFIHRAFYFSRD